METDVSPQDGNMNFVFRYIQIVTWIR